MDFLKSHIIPLVYREVLNFLELGGQTFSKTELHRCLCYHISLINARLKKKMV